MRISWSKKCCTLLSSEHQFEDGKLRGNGEGRVDFVNNIMIKIHFITYYGNK